MWNLKYDTNEPTYETETESGTQRADLWLPRGWRLQEMGWETGSADASPHTRKGEQQVLTAQHRELCSLFHDEP